MKKKRNTKYKSSALALLLTILFLLSCAGGAAWSVWKFYESLNSSLTKMNEKPIATITFKYKTAQRKFEERMIWDRLRQQSPVYDGDTIRTAPGSEATIYFNDGNVMELGENTMAQVFFHDGQVETSVSGGTFVVDSSGSENGALVKTDNSTVVVNAGAAISADVSDEEGTRVSVSSGEILFTDESGAARAVEEGNSIAVDSDGGEKIIPLITVTSPAPNAKILAFDGSKESVAFKWSVQNLAAGDGLVLQTARDKKFKTAGEAIDLDGLNEISVDFEAGPSYWRIYPKEAGPKYSAQSKLKILSAPAPSLIAPESRSAYSYKTKPPDLRFTWTTNDVVTAFDLEIADNPQMQNPVFSQRTTTPSSIVSTLENGTWYWRVTPFYTINGIGLGKPSETRAFSITRRQKIPAPELILPADGETINTALKDQINFSWKNNPEAVSYEICVSDDPQCYEAKILRTTKTNFFTARPSENEMAEGTWYWRVVQYDANGDISEQSEIRKFATDRVFLEQRALYPPDNFSATAGDVAELRFTWKTNVPGDTRFQIARDKAFANLAVDQVDNEKFFEGAKLDDGTYYWRITSATEEGTRSTEPRALRVLSNLSRPVLVYPRADETLTIYGAGETRFRWNQVRDAGIYQFNLFNLNSPDEFIESRTLSENFVALDLSRVPDGAYGWSVRALAEESAVSARRTGEPADGGFKIIQLRKIDLQYPANGATIDGFNALAYPDSVRWSCEQELSGGVLTLSKNQNGYSNAIFSVQNPARIVRLPRLEPGVYYWTVRARNAAGADASPDRAFSFTVLGVSSLPSPRLSLPAANKVFGPAEIRASRKIEFAWQPVPNATSYSIAVRNERGQVVASRSLTEPRWTIADMADLQNGRFTYSVQAFQNLPDGTLARKSGAATGTFVINLPAAGDVIINDTGVLYGM